LSFGTESLVATAGSVVGSFGGIAATSSGGVNGGVSSGSIVIFTILDSAVGLLLWWGLLSLVGVLVTGVSSGHVSVWHTSLWTGGVSFTSVGLVDLGGLEFNVGDVNFGSIDFESWGSAVGLQLVSAGLTFGKVLNGEGFNTLVSVGKLLLGTALG
jgi:hypothetical protein